MSKLKFFKDPLEKFVDREIAYNQNRDMHMKMDIQRTMHIVRCLAEDGDIDQNNYDNLMNVILLIVCKTMAFIINEIPNNENEEQDFDLFEDFVDELTDQIKNVYCIGYYKLGGSPFVKLMIYQTFDLIVDFYIREKYDFKSKEDIIDIIRRDNVIETENPDRKVQTANRLVNIYFSILICILSDNHSKELKNVRRVLSKMDNQEIYKACLVFIYEPDKPIDLLSKETHELAELFNINCKLLLDVDKLTA